MIKADTKNILCNSFHDLLKKQCFANITVQDIVDNCGASRATFYRHFKDKYDLMNWDGKEFIEKCITKSPDLIEYKRILFQCVCNTRDNCEYLTKIVNIQGQNSYLDFLYNFSTECWYKYFIQETDRSKLTDEVILSVKFFHAGLVQIMNDWLNTNCAASPEKITQLLFDCTPPLLISYFKK